MATYLRNCGTEIMEHNQHIHALTHELEILTRMHIVYRLESCPQFFAKKREIEKMVSQYRIDIRRDLDPISQNLYKRYIA